MKKTIFLIFSIFILCNAVFAEPEIKGTPNELSEYLKTLPETVVISTEATYEVQADSAVAIISVITENASLKKSLEQNQNLRNQIIAKLRNSGIGIQKITGTKFSSTPKHSILSKKPTSYIVENILKIVVSNDKEFQLVADIMDSNKEVYYRELKFEHTDREKHRLKVLDKAFDNIQEKKNLYEKRLGVTLTPKRFFDQKAPEYVLNEELRYKKSEYASKISSSTSGATPIFGELIYKASLNVEYIVKTKN